MELRTIAPFSAKRWRAVESGLKSCAWSGPTKAGYERVEDFGRQARTGVEGG